jgi:hypothetical protein
MNRFKEISYVLCLSFLFFATVQLSFYISKKPSLEQRIPVLEEASFELSANPLSLIKEVLSTELFEVKNQAFLNQIHQFKTSIGTKNELEGINIDLNQAMSLLLINSKEYKGPLIHFNSVKSSTKKTLGKHYVQLGNDVFYAPTKPITSKQAKWILNKVKWTSTSISTGQFFVQQRLNGELSEGKIQWNKNELHYVTEEMKTNQTVILSPRYFHYSNQFPSKILDEIPLEINMRSMLITLDQISLNYEGGKLTEDQQFPFAPSFEALLTYKNPAAMERAIQTMKSVYDSLEWKEQTVKMGIQNIFFQRTSPKTLYICSNKNQYCPNGNPNLTRSNTGFLCKGDLGRLTSIKNTGWAGLVLDMIPAFRASKELFDGTKNISSSKNGIEITFKPGKAVLHELLKTLIVYRQE